MNVSFLIPFRSPVGSWRDRLRLATARMYEGLGVEVVYGTDGRPDGAPWNCSAALNDARSQASGDVLWKMGCDHLPPTPAVIDRVCADLEALPWTAVWESTRELTEMATRKLLAGIPLRRLMRQTIEAAPTCMGITAVRAEVWDDVRGMDERFEGWGFEDTAFRTTLAALHPSGRAEGEGSVLTLWHPRPADQWEGSGLNAARYREYVRAKEAGTMREYVESR